MARFYLSLKHKVTPFYCVWFLSTTERRDKYNQINPTGIEPLAAAWCCHELLEQVIVHKKIPKPGEQTCDLFGFRFIYFSKAAPWTTRLLRPVHLYSKSKSRECYGTSKYRVLI